MEQRNSAAANTRLRHTDWHALWSPSYACAWCTPFSKGTFPLVNPLRGNIPLAGAHFRALLAPVTGLLYGAKIWQLRQCTCADPPQPRVASGAASRGVLPLLPGSRQTPPPAPVTSEDLCAEDERLCPN